MALKLVWVLFAALASQGFCSAIPNKFPKLEDVDSAILQLAQAIQGAIQEAVKTLLDIIKSMSSDADVMIENAEKEIQIDIDLLLTGDLETMRTLSEDLGVDVQECIEENKAIIINLPNKCVLALKACVKQQINEGNKIVNRFWNAFDHVWIEIDRLAEELQRCTGTTTSLCHYKIFREVAIKRIVYLKKVAYKLKTTNKLNVLNCRDETMDKIRIEALENVIQVAQCIVHKVNATTL